MCTLTSASIRSSLPVFQMPSKVVLLVSLLLVADVFSFAYEKLQVMTTKKVPDCNRRSKVGDTLYMQYTVNVRFSLSRPIESGDVLQGVLKSNGVKFDSSYDRGQPFVFTIGKRQAIQGWDQGLLE